jgi:hypothetical protein
VLTLGSWASLTIAGMMLKIVPFLVWYRAYSPHVGRVPVPTLAQLSWPTVEGLAFALLSVGMAGLAVAAVVGEVSAIRAAGLIVAAGAVAFAAALARVLGHLRSAAVPARQTGGLRAGSAENLANDEMRGPDMAPLPPRLDRPGAPTAVHD